MLSKNRGQQQKQSLGASHTIWKIINKTIENGNSINSIDEYIFFVKRGAKFANREI